MSEDRRPGLPNPAGAAPPTVLVAIDFSDDSRAALRWAGRYAALTEGRLVVLHVVHDPADQPGYYRENHGNHLQPMQAVAETMLNEFVDGLMAEPGAPGVLATAQRELVIGLPPGRIVEASERHQAELIVIGSRGMTGLPHMLQGSVSERVVELADRAVVVVKAKGKRRTEEAKRAEKLRRRAEKAQRKAEKKARKQKAALDVREESRKPDGG